MDVGKARVRLYIAARGRPLLRRASAIGVEERAKSAAAADGDGNGVAVSSGKGRAFASAYQSCEEMWISEEHAGDFAEERPHLCVAHGAARIRRRRRTLAFELLEVKTAPEVAAVETGEVDGVCTR